MCELCINENTSKDEKEAIRQGLNYRADQLEAFAAKVRLMSAGRLKPHTPEASTMSVNAHYLIRFLVEYFM